MLSARDWTEANYNTGSCSGNSVSSSGGSDLFELQI